MKILIINDYPAIVGGAERFLENLVHEAGASAFDFQRMDMAALAGELHFATKSKLFSHQYSRIRVFPELVRMITNQIQSIRPDLIHLNNNNLFTNSVLRSLLDAGLPVVSFIHDHYALRRLRSPWYLNTSRQFIFLTHSAEIYQPLVAMTYKAHLVKVPFNHAKWEHVHDENCIRTRADLLYVGRIEKNKGIFKLVRAIESIKKHLPAVKVAILGDGSRLNELKRIVIRKNLSANVDIRGQQHDKEICDYYHHARILVFPSPAESLGYVGLEAQSCGIPVIAFENKGSSRWCSDNQSGFLIKGKSAQKLAEKVLEIIHDDVILTRISSTARENIRLEGYNASKQEITDIYKAVLSW